MSKAEPADDALPELTYRPWLSRERFGPVCRVLGCFAICGLIFTGLLLAGAAWYNSFMMGQHLDRLGHDVLADGDAETAYRRAHPQLQALYPREAFLEFARQRPSVFRRDKLTGVEVRWLTGAGGLYAVLTARVQEDEGEAEVVYYCVQTGTQTFRLIGIAPGLDAAVPPRLEPFR
jgi:hypothetical protein